MKYKILLTGGNKDIINDFFSQLIDTFECLSSSMLYPDLINHLTYFQPDAVVYCMNAETRSNMETIIRVRQQMQKDGIPLVLICNSQDYAFYRNLPSSSSELLLVKPITAFAIRDKLTQYLNEKASSPSSTQDTIDYNALMSEINLAQPDKKNIDYNALMTELDMINPRKRILVIDDATVMLKTINEHLKQDYEVATAINGKLARKYLEGRTVDLILLDYEMPVEDGPTVFQQLRNNPLTANIPVVFLTGINNTEKIQKALSLKPAGYLLKPVDKNTLLAKIREILG